VRVKIGNYIHHYNTTYVERDYLSWRYGEKSFSLKEKDYDLLDNFVITALDFWQDVLNITVNKIQAMRDRKVKIQIDRWDTWNADHTLALIILPMLKQLKETKHGGPWVDAEDVPEELAISREEMNKHDWEDDVDPNWFNRWDYVLSEMIFAFEMIANDDWESAFYSGKSDMISKPVNYAGEEVDRESADFFEWVEGPNHTFEVNHDAIRAIYDRVDNGTRLFGKYFRNLWD
jgi:hypothetical protein